MTRGYVQIRAVGHPRASSYGYVLEHVIIAEKALGRALPAGAQVHHFDENKANNANGNLVLCPDHAYHWLLHRRQRAMAACGDPNAHKCYLCKGYGDQEDITVCNLRNGQFYASHRKCGAEYQRRRKARLRSQEAV